MNMKRKMLSLALAVCLAAGLAVPAAAAGAVEAVPCRYSEVHAFSEGLAVVVMVDANWNRQYGAIDKTGKEIVPVGKYLSVSDFSEGMAAVAKQGEGYGRLYGFVDKTGQEVVPCTYEFAGDFSEGLALVRNVDGQCGFIDKTGKEVIPCQYEDYRTGMDDEAHFSEGLAPVMKDGMWGFIDKTGKEVIPFQYDYSMLTPNFSDGLAPVMRDGKWGFVDAAGKEAIPCTLDYDEVYPFCEGMAVVRRYDESAAGKWGYIDKTGKEAVPCKYESALDFSEGLGAVELDNKWGVVDKTGKEVLPCRYTERDYQGPQFSEGLATVKLNEQWGFVDKTGKEVVPCQYGAVESFSEGFAAVCVGDFYGDGKWGLIAPNGGEVVPAAYDGMGRASESMVAVAKKNANGEKKWGFLSLSGATASAPAAKLAYASTQNVNVDGKSVEFQCYALKDANGNATNYIKLRDLAMLLNGTAAQFQVGWDGSVTITTGTAYTANGSEGKTPFSGDRAYKENTAETKVDGKAAALGAFVLSDDAGGGYTYYQLRDLGKALGFNVGWSADKGIFVETDKPYDPAN